MKKSLASLAAVVAIAIMGFAGAVSAEEAQGTIQDMDLQSRTIVLDDGNTYVVSEGVAIESLQPGTEVTVSFEDQGGQLVASDVIPAQ